MDQTRGPGFDTRTRLRTARERLREIADPVERTERLPVSTAVGRTLADAVTARRPVPHYDRVAVDGVAVRASDTFEADDRSPAVLDQDERVHDRDAVPVQAGAVLPAGADAVVPIAETTVEDGRVEVFGSVATGANVEAVGASAEADETVLSAGRRLRPSDPGLCRAAGVSRVQVRERPTVGVLPVGADLVDGDPQPGETVETDGLTVSTFAERWGAEAVYRDPVADDRHALRPAVERDLTKDVLVTIGGTGAGESDRVPAVVDDLGDVLAHGLAIAPGGSAGIGLLRETPVAMLPGPSVACLVAAVGLVKPAVEAASGREPGTHPTTKGRLASKLASEPGIRTFARVAIEDQPAEFVGGESDDAEDEPMVRPVRTGGPNAIESVAAADGWVAVPEEREGIPAGERVTVQDWEAQP